MKSSSSLVFVLIATLTVLTGCGGGGPSNYWEGIIRNTTNLSSGATLYTCAAHFSSAASCYDRTAADACFASYPYKPVPSNAVYLCSYVN